MPKMKPIIRNVLKNLKGFVKTQMKILKMNILKVLKKETIKIKLNMNL